MTPQRNGEQVLNNLLSQFPYDAKNPLNNTMFLRWVREKYGYDSFEYKVANEYVNFPAISKGALAFGTGEDF